MVLGTDFYAQVPKRLQHALERGELSFGGHGILAYFHGVADERREVARTLKALSDCIRWKASDDSLWRELRALREGEWIDFDSRAGQRGPYVFRLAKADLRTTSALDPPLRAEVTSAVPRSGDGAKPYVEPSRPPHDLRTAEPLKKEKKENDDDDFDEEFEHAIEPLGYLTREQRSEVRAAWRENRGGVQRCLAERASGRQPTGLFMRMIKDGKHRTGGPGADASGADAVTASLAIWIRNEGRHYDYATVEEEIDRRERRDKAQLSVPQKQQLYELWDELHVEPTA